jgi:hypothetical protein
MPATSMTPASQMMGLRLESISSGRPMAAAGGMFVVPCPRRRDTASLVIAKLIAALQMTQDLLHGRHVRRQASRGPQRVIAIMTNLRHTARDPCRHRHRSQLTWIMVFAGGTRCDNRRAWTTTG